MARDGSSGGVIRLVTIDKSGVSREFIPGKEEGREGGREGVYVWREGGRAGESHVIARDGSSGGVIRLVTIDMSGVLREFIPGKEGGREGGRVRGRGRPLFTFSQQGGREGGREEQ